MVSRLFRHRSSKISKLCITGLCEGNRLVTVGLPSQRASNTEIDSIWWNHHVQYVSNGVTAVLKSKPSTCDIMGLILSYVPVIVIKKQLICVSWHYHTLSPFDSNISYLVTWWCHQMETFFALLAICTGNSPITGEFPAQRPGARSFDVFFDLHLNKLFSKQWWGWWFETPSCPLWRHHNELFLWYLMFQHYET